MSRFDRTRLSERENAILDLAIDGLTDAQMAQKLGIAVSTVNSYWVRIRGKLGYYSRTEFVSMAVRSTAKVEIQRLSKQNSEFERRLKAQEYAGANTDRSHFYRAALDAIPDALFVCSLSGVVLLANDRFRKMFGLGPDDAEGLLFDSFLYSRNSLPVSGVLNSSVERNSSLRLGVDEVLYARRRDGSEMRVIVLVDFRTYDPHPVFSCIVRNFVDEVDVRRKFAASYVLLS